MFRTALRSFSVFVSTAAILVLPAASQDGDAVHIQPSRPADAQQPAPPAKIITIPAGTKVLLQLTNSVSTRSARKGDGVYLQTNFPVIADGRVVIPAGTYVQGVIDRVQRSGRIKGRAEVLMHFTHLIYPNGYLLTMPGSLESADSSDTQKVKDKEGTIQAQGSKGRDAGVIAATTASGAGIGAATRGVRGLGIGSGIGAAAGVLETLFTRGEEVRLEAGTNVEMVLERALDVDVSRVPGAPADYRVPAPPTRVIVRGGNPSASASPLPIPGLPR